MAVGTVVVREAVEQNGVYVEGKKLGCVTTKPHFNTAFCCAGVRPALSINQVVFVDGRLKQISDIQQTKGGYCVTLQVAKI